MPASPLTRPRRLGHVAAVAAITVGSLLAVAAPASATTCLFDAGTRTATAHITDTEFELRLAADNGNLEANGMVCGALTAIDSVVVNMSARSSGQAAFDLSGGALGPGFTNEGDGSSEIEFSILGLSNSGRIAVTGSNGSDTITVGQGSGGQGNLDGRLNLNAAADGATPDVDLTFPVFPFQLVVDGGTGDDSVSGAGITAGGMAYSQQLVLIGGKGTNQMTGGSGNDQLRVLTEVISTGSDAVSGGSGFDQVGIDTESTIIASTYSRDGIANDGVGCPGVSCEGDNIALDIEGMSGSAGPETLIGSDQSDVLVGGGGKDMLKGLAGFDNLQCSGGRALGGPQDDSILLNKGCVSASGGSGRDEASFATAEQAVTVTIDGVRNDGYPGFMANVMTDVENLYGSNFADTMTGNDKRNQIIGTNGSDTLVGGGGPDRLVGYQGGDTLAGGLGDDNLLGGAGNDTLDGGDGVDVCTQGPGAGAVSNCE